MQTINSKWVFILGGSSGFGLATAQLMASKGYNLFIVHRNRKTQMQIFVDEVEKLIAMNVLVHHINVNAVDKESQVYVLKELRQVLGAEGKVKTVLHSLADGNLNPIIGFEKFLEEEDFMHTINSMGISFVTWTQLLYKNGFLENGSKIIGITSEGSQKVLPNYAAVGTAKSVLETASRYLAVEMAKFGITVNIINAGVADTPALRAIPNAKELLNQAISKNPFKRLTTPQDIANVVWLLSQDEASWINGVTIRADGGEQIVG